MHTRRVIVVGAGVGGLVTALELAALGLEVLVLEAAAQVGGKMRQVTVGGAAMDAGPTVFTMRWVFEELFDAVGARLADHLQLQPAGILARHAWSAHERLDLFADVKRSAEAIDDFAGANASRGYLNFCTRAREMYRALEHPFLRSARPSPLTLAQRMGLRGLPDLMRISPFARMWPELGRHFADPRLRQLFGRYANYCGVSPFEASATLMLVAHVEQDGVWLVEGGMHRVAQVLAANALERGASIRLESPVSAILTRDGRACGVRLANGEELSAAAVVFNGDVAALGAGLLGEAVRPSAARVAPAERSFSAVTWNLLASTQGFPLSRHTVFFSNDYAAEFQDIGRGRLAASPTVYVCAQDRSDVDDARMGAERLLVVVNAPATGDTQPATLDELQQCEAQAFGLMARCGLSVERAPENTVMTTPQDFDRRFPATGGALYGPALRGWLASFSRPGARSSLPGLYLAGGSVHPGPGVPMAALSGRQAAASVMADRVRAPAAGRPVTAPAHPGAAPSSTSSP